MRLRVARRRRRDDGQALVEFVLVAPLLILLLFGIIEFGIYLNQYDGATNLAEMGARQVIVLGGLGNTLPACTSANYQTTSTSGSLLVYLQCQAQNSGTAVPTMVCVLDSGSAVSTSTPMGPGDTITVKVNSSFKWGGLAGLNILNSTVSGASTMRNEQNVASGSTQNAFVATNNSNNCS